MTNNSMLCGLCENEVHPLDAHMGRLNGKLDVFHIDCWNKREVTEHSDISKAASAMGKLGGSSKSKAKSSASRENGKLGGRPKKAE